MFHKNVALKCNKDSANVRKIKERVQFGSSFEPCKPELDGSADLRAKNTNIVIFPSQTKCGFVICPYAATES